MLIEIDKLRLRLGGAVILHDVRLSLGEGEIYGLLGPNGAGKSTTIAAALGLLAPDAGTVRVFGRDPRQEARTVHARLGALPEHGGFYDWMTGERYLGFFAALYGRRFSPSELRDRLARVDLVPRVGQTIGSYSRGMRQRLGLARALLVDPPLLILDEPTSGLDPRGRRDVHDILLGLAERGVGILLSTHLLDDVDRLCHRIGIIVEGRTVAEGNVADLLWVEGHDRRYRLRLAGEPPPAEVGHVAIVDRDGDWWTVDIDPAWPADATWRDLIAGGWRIAEIHREGGGLENLYLALTAGGTAA
ncbi:MAG TPA: ABC transporter ATP-binding protein [Candidatus Angelobacter sp.]|nr:ABC transporter ATP-binding protein [Candidatus Angelobacter sp.]